jgi:RHS repeat-associated protein
VGANVKNQISSNAYDAAGNMTTGGNTYDPENHLIGTAGVTYTYDGDGRRVMKSNGKLYWFGMGSDALDETDGTGSTSNSAFNEYVFLSGKRIARRDSSGNVFFYFADHLGTSRVIVQSGQTTPCYDADFYPFGGEHGPFVNTCPQNYKFTGKERDSESGLDNFGARFDSSALGRFLSPDAGAASLHNPQSWNRYTYALNNPLFYIDPDGNQGMSATRVIGTMEVTFWVQQNNYVDWAGMLQSLYGLHVSPYNSSIGGGGKDPYTGGTKGIDPFISGARRSVNTTNNPLSGGCLFGCIYGYDGVTKFFNITIKFYHGKGGNGKDGQGPINGVDIGVEFNPDMHAIGTPTRGQRTFVPGGMGLMPDVTFNITAYDLRELSDEELAYLIKDSVSRFDNLHYAILRAAYDEQDRREREKKRKEKEEEERKRKKCPSNGDCPPPS